MRHALAILGQMLREALWPRGLVDASISWVGNLWFVATVGVTAVLGEAVGHWSLGSRLAWGFGFLFLVTLARLAYTRMPRLTFGHVSMKEVDGQMRVRLPVHNRGGQSEQLMCQISRVRGLDSKESEWLQQELDPPYVVLTKQRYRSAEGQAQAAVSRWALGADQPKEVELCQVADGGIEVRHESGTQTFGPYDLVVEVEIFEHAKGRLMCWVWLLKEANGWRALRTNRVTDRVSWGGREYENPFWE